MCPPAGRTVAHYELLDRLGAGGQGEVYRGHDPRLRRPVAIKLLQSSYARDRGRLARFEQEARAASSLNHPNIVTIYDIGQTESGPYIVMELVEGRTFREIFAAPPRFSRRTLDLAVQMADGLAKAHAAGIVHRDLKPENLMVTNDGFVKILDFGLAKLVAAPEDDDPTERPTASVSPEETQDAPQTRPGAVLGTAGYLSPEQARGDVADFQADQFSLGAILYEMITGRRAFLRKTNVQALAAIIEEQPEPIGALCPEAPAPLRWIVERCLAKEPRDRYESTLDLARELGQVREHFGEALPVTSGAASQASLRRGLRRDTSLALSATLVVGLALAAGWNDLRNVFLPLPQEKHLAVLPFENPGGDARSRAFSDGLVEMLTSKLTQLERFQGALWVVPSSEVRGSGIETAATAHRALGATLAITGSVQRSGEAVLMTINLVDAVRLRQLRATTIDSRLDDVAALQEGVVRSIARMLELEIGPEESRILAGGATAVSEAYRLYVEGLGYLRRYESEASLHDAVASFQQALQRDDDYALAYAGLGLAQLRLWQLTGDREAMDLARTAGARALALNDLLAPVHVTMGLIHVGTGSPEEGVADFRRGLALDPVSGEAQLGLAQAQEALGRIEDAEATYLKAVELRPDDWGSHSRLGAFYSRQGRFEAAEREFERVVAITPDNVRGYANLGAVLHLSGRDDEAVAALSRALSIRRTAQAASNLATIQFFRGRYAEAARAFEQAIAIDGRDYRVWRNLASSYYWAPGERERAPAAYQRAAEMAEADLPVNPRDPEVLVLLADCYSMLGEEGRARELVARALELAPGDVAIMRYAGGVYERLGDRGRALRWILAALAGGFARSQIDHDPALAELRADPHFERQVASRQER